MWDKTNIEPADDFVKHVCIHKFKCRTKQIWNQQAGYVNMYVSYFMHESYMSKNKIKNANRKFKKT